MAGLRAEQAGEPAVRAGAGAAVPGGGDGRGGPGAERDGAGDGAGALDKLVVYAGNVGKFLEADQGYWSQVWAVGVDRERVRSGELYEPVGVPSASYKPFCLDEKLAARLWDWTEEELKPWLA